MQLLSRDFFAQDTLKVAPALLGKVIKFKNHIAVITEVEAYGGSDDSASHAFKLTKRSKVMAEKPGFLYVYLIYGMHYCLNFVTAPAGVAGAVLVRAIKIGTKDIVGPGRVTNALGIDLSYNNTDLMSYPDFAVYDDNITVTIKTSARIGISKAQDKQWRFFI